MPKGRYVVLEGDEGAGKGTQAQLLKDWLLNQGVAAEVVREPGGDPIGEQLREILKFSPHPISPLAETFGFCMARANALEYVVKPKLEAGIWVVGDRNYLSTLIYQGIAGGMDDDNFFRKAMGGELGPKQVFMTIVIAATAPAVPDLTIVLDIPPEVSLQRLHDRGDKLDRFERASEEFRLKVNSSYRNYTGGAYKGYAGVDGNRSAIDVHFDIVRLIQPLLQEKMT